MVPGNAEEAAGIEVDEEPEGEEEPAHMLNGTALCVWGSLQTPRPSLDLHSASSSPLTPPSTCLHFFTRVELFVLPSETDDAGFSLRAVGATFIQFHIACCISFPGHRTLDRLSY